MNHPTPDASTRNPLGLAARCRVASALSPLLCDLVAIESHAHQARWNTRAADVVAAREQFRLLARAAAEWSETVACRLSQLGFAVKASLRQAAGMTTIDDYPEKLASGAEHATLLAARLAQLDQAVHRAVGAAQGASDHVTGHTCLRLAAEVEAFLEVMEACQPLPLMEAARPDSDKANPEPRDAVEEASMESFPASDPPATRVVAE